MIRFGSLALGLLACTGTVALCGKIEIAPPPREVGQPLVEAQNPAETVERIVQNAKSAGERLAQNDPGKDTRKTQSDILRDIDALIHQQENPPPMKTEPKENPPKSDPKDKNGQPPPMPDQSQPMPKPKDGSGDPGGEKRPGESKPSPGLPSRSGGDSQANNPRPRAHRNRPMPQGTENRPSQAEPMAGTGPKEKAGQPSAKKDSGSPTAGGVSGKVPPSPLLPFAGDVTKEAWGHLPEQLRQQVSAYYKEQFMPQYAELLRQYYSSLAERERKPATAPNR